MKTAIEWDDKYHRLINYLFANPHISSTYPFMETVPNDMRDIILDLAAMEKLAIGGEGETHYYYKDVVEDLRKHLDEAVKALDALAHIPAVLAVLGREHVGKCTCPLCHANEIVSKAKAVK